LLVPLSHCPFSFISSMGQWDNGTSNDIKEKGQWDKQWYKRKRTMGYIIAGPIVPFPLYHCLSHCRFPCISLLVPLSFSISLLVPLSFSFYVITCPIVPLSFFFYIIAGPIVPFPLYHCLSHCPFSKKKDNGTNNDIKEKRQWDNQWHKRKSTMGQAMI
jgi:hypothetical protein